jgi:Transposase DDE domain
MERLSYFMHNPSISDEVFYVPLLKQFLQEWTGQELILVMDTSMFWDTYCLIEVCVAWGGRSITLAQTVIKHGSSTVGFEQYLPVLEAAKSRLPAGAQPTLLADRGFEHGELMRWLTAQQWNWGIRVKSNLQIVFGNGKTQSLKELFPPKDQVYLFPGVKVLGDIECNLGTANCRGVKEPWAVLTNTPLSLQTFQLYGQRFGGIEPRFKDYKSGTFDILRSKIRDAQALSNLLMMIEIAEVVAIRLGLIVMETRSRSKIDWHGERGLSLLQLGIRTVKSLCHQALLLPILTPIPWLKIPPACASLKKRRTPVGFPDHGGATRQRAKLEKRIEFAKVMLFAY